MEGSTPTESPQPPSRPPVRFARGSSGFEAELAAYLQERLRLVAGFLAVSSTLLLLVGRASDLAAFGPDPAQHLHPSVLTHAAACAAGGGLWWVLRSRRLSARGLLLVDAVVAGVLTGTCLLVYLFSYQTGIRQLPALLGLLLIARAVVVPSRALRTFLLSLPAAPGVLLIQLSRGTAFLREGVEIPPGSFAAWVVWDQATLWLAVATATAASKVNFGLRLRAWSAQQVDRYTLEGRLGIGAMGEVYRARHGLLRRPTAIKILRPEITGEAMLRRFEHEVRQTARLEHPNTVRVYDYGTTPDGVFYYAMELLDGADLQRVVEATGPMPAARVVHLLSQCCGALAEAHGIGLIHRDVKPANVVLCRRGGEDDVAKLMDFGLVMDVSPEAARLDEGGPCGTPLTMAPEVILRRPVSPATDLYSLGAVGCFLLTGQPLFDVAGPGEFLGAHLREEPRRPSASVPGVPADLEEVLLRCLRKDPGARFPDAAALREALLSCADAGRWGRADAKRWWDRHGASLGPGDEGAGAGAGTGGAGVTTPAAAAG
jgi:serine/threonine-protein kinase